MIRHLSLIALIAILPAFAPAAEPDAKAMRELYDRVSPSLVVVQYTYDGELGRREIDGAGVVIGTDGLIICSGTLTPSVFPDDHMKDFKILIPGDDENELDAAFQGRDERTGLAFVKAKDASRKWTPIKFEDLATNVGDTIFSVGLLPKNAGYKPYLITTHVAAALKGPVPLVLSGGEGLAAVGSPVFNADGKAIGLVSGQQGQSPMLNEPDSHSNALASVMNPPHMFVPAGDLLIGLNDPPQGKPLQIPWTGVSQLTGLKKEVAEYYGLKNQPAVQIGDVVPDAPAAGAGIKSGDVIVKLDGELLERGDSPEETWRILVRKISRMKVGQEITFSILTARDAPPKDVKLTLAERPQPAGRAKRYFAEDLGFTVRQIVFEDTYERKLPKETPGVVVAFIKPSSSAQSARLANGDLITQFNGQPVKNLDDFKAQYDAFRKDKPKEAAVLEVMRGVDTQVIRIEPPQ